MTKKRHLSNMDLIDKWAVLAELNEIVNKNSKIYDVLNPKIKAITKMKPVDVVAKVELEYMVSDIEQLLQQDLKQRESTYKDIIGVLHKYIDGDEYER